MMQVAARSIRDGNQSLNPTFTDPVGPSFAAYTGITGFFPAFLITIQGLGLGASGVFNIGASQFKRPVQESTKAIRDHRRLEGQRGYTVCIPSFGSGAGMIPRKARLA